MKRKNVASIDECAQPKTNPINNNLPVGIDLLWQAYCYAREASVDLWDFALEIDKLYAIGLTISDLRWLVAKKLVEHGRESSVYGAPHRAFHRGAGFVFDSRTCVVLTPSGATFAGRFLNHSSGSPQPSLLGATACIAGGGARTFENQPAVAVNLHESRYFACKPCWHKTRRELWLDRVVVKRFRVPAQNQVVILSAFEEDGWPAQIDDPLPNKGDVNPHVRLHDAVNRLNRAQTNPLVRFHGNGSGTGISWKLCRPVESRQID
jgi:hypothetical protein